MTMIKKCISVLMIVTNSKNQCLHLMSYPWLLVKLKLVLSYQWRSSWTSLNISCNFFYISANLICYISSFKKKEKSGNKRSSWDGTEQCFKAAYFLLEWLLNGNKIILACSRKKKFRVKSTTGAMNDK